MAGRRRRRVPGLDAAETLAAVEAGRRTLARAGLAPRGFVAPGYAYTRALRAALAGSFDWWATLLRVLRDGEQPRPVLAPACCLGTSSRVKRALSAPVVRTTATVAGGVLRLDVHPADLEHHRNMLALEAVLRRAGRRRAVTYDELADRAG